MVVGKQYYIYLLLKLVILLILGSILTRFHVFLLKDAIVVKKVIGLVFCSLAYSVFSFLALVLIIEAFLARTLGIAVLIAFLPTIYKCIFFITIVDTAPVLEPIYLLFLTLLGVALCLYLNSFSLHLGRLFLLSSIFN